MVIHTLIEHDGPAAPLYIYVYQTAKNDDERRERERERERERGKYREREREIYKERVYYYTDERSTFRYTLEWRCKMRGVSMQVWFRSNIKDKPSKHSVHSQQDGPLNLHSTLAKEFNTI